MRISSITINGFKRFSKLEIIEIPESARVVLVAGPNGNGKSSLFDAFNSWSRLSGGQGWHSDREYFDKTVGQALTGPQTAFAPMVSPYGTGNVEIRFHGQQPAQRSICAKMAFNVRTAFRIDPEIAFQALTKIGSPLDEQGALRMIDGESRVTKNYLRLVSDAFDGAFERADGQLSVSEWREQVIGSIRDSVCRILPDLRLNGLGSPLRDPTFRFTKGSSHSFVF